MWLRLRQTDAAPVVPQTDVKCLLKMTKAQIKYLLGITSNLFFSKYL
jgi:hypothetical protein